MFSWFINTCHINGITTFVARTAHKNLKMPYSEFYAKLLDYLMHDAWFSREYATTEEYYLNWMTDGKINHPKLGNISIHGWNLIHRTIINIHANDLYDHVFSLVESFVRTLNISKHILDAALMLQKHYIVRYCDIQTYPVSLSLPFDIVGYLNDNILENADYTLDFPDDKTMSFEKFLELIYYSRRRNFGKVTISC